MKIEPKQYSNSDGYYVAFHHPIEKKTIRKGLMTKREIDAKAICQDAVALFSNAEVLQHPTATVLVAYERRAVELVFGEEKAKEILGDAPRGLTPEDVAELKSKFPDEQAALDQWDQTGTWPSQAELGTNFLAALKDFDPRARRIADERRRDAEKALKVVTRERDQLEEENRRLRRQQSVHVKIKIGEAFDSWKQTYKEGHSEKTYREAIRSVEWFVDSLPRKDDTLLREITAGTIDHWVETMKATDGETLSPPTKRARRAYLSTFFSHVVRKYDMYENPLDKVGRIAGADRVREDIRAIRRMTEIKELLESLKPISYWRAWAAFAILAGPRFTEQRYVEVGDVYLDDDGDYIILNAKKTGKQRRVAIEQTIHKEILKEHVARRKREQQETGSSPALKTAFLFPSLKEEGTRARTKTPPGIWSDSSAFLDAWEKVVAEVGSPKAKDAISRYRAAKIKEVEDAEKEEREPRPIPQWQSGDYWDYGPAEWRHTFGTVLGHCGFTSLEISRYMGNSPVIADRHYVAATASGERNRWPLKY